MGFWSEVTRIIGGNAAYFTRSGFVYSKIGKLEEAIADYNRAIALNPDFAEAYSLRGFAYSKIGKLEEAIADYNRAIALNPDFAEAYSLRGVAYSKIGKLEEAIADYNRAIALNPDFAKAYSLRGVAYSKIGKLEEAIADCSRAIALNPDFAEAYSFRGLVYSEIGKLEEAIADCSRAIALNPDFAKAYSLRGFVYSKIGKLEEAIADCSRAIALNPDFADAYSFREEIFRQKKELETTEIISQKKESESSPFALAESPNPLPPTPIIEESVYEPLIDELLPLDEETQKELIEIMKPALLVADRNPPRSNNPNDRQEALKMYRLAIEAMIHNIALLHRYCASDAEVTELMKPHEKAIERCLDYAPSSYSYVTDIGFPASDYFRRRLMARKESQFVNEELTDNRVHSESQPATRPNLKIVGGTNTEPQLLSESTRINLALAKIKQGQEELRHIIPTITEVGALYRIWKANAGLEEEIGERLKSIFPQISKEVTANFFVRPNSTGTLYVGIEWTIKQEGQAKRKHETISLGRDDVLDPPQKDWIGKQSERKINSKKGHTLP